MAGKSLKEDNVESGQHRLGSAIPWSTQYLSSLILDIA